MIARSFQNAKWQPWVELTSTNSVWSEHGVLPGPPGYGHRVYPYVGQD